MNYIVTLKDGQKITFDVNHSTGCEGYEAILLAMEQSIYVCLFTNKIDPDLARIVTTSADWENIFYKEHGPMPVDFSGDFSFEVGEKLNAKFAHIFNKETLLKWPPQAKIRYL
jgi:hypothetical protein